MPPPPPPPLQSQYVEGPSVNFLMVMNVINTLTHLLLGAVAFSAVFFANMFMSSSLTQHVYLCVIGYVILMSEAVLCLNPNTGWAKAIRHENRRMVHLVLQIFGSILVITGSIIRMNGVTNNFNSAHGILGLIAMILTILSLIGGIMNLLSPKLNINAVIIKICHACLGSGTLIIAFTTLCLGFDNVFRNVLGDTNANLSIVITVFALVGTIITPLLNIFRRIF